ncbi:MAG: hypothetical protein ABEJ91_02965 [Candidatus Nanohaloarchaea archaeon]
MRQLLRSILVTESRAYGFTIAFWGSGALLINAFGVPAPIQVFLYASGAIAGFAAVSLIAFSSLMETAENEEANYLVLSMVHYLASLGPLVITYFLLDITAWIAFFLSGASVSMVYNLLQLLEEFVSEELKEFEEEMMR